MGWLCSYFGNTIQKTFFDDVGFWKFPRSWTARFNETFEALYGYDPKPYYPALWYDIGPETESIRNAFFNTRAEMLAESYPKLVAEWNERHGLQSTGHPPGNYDPTPVDMNGDIFKFYRYTQIPLADVILNYQFGQNGHKLISSAADYYDRPIVSVEIYGAFRKRDVHFDKAMLYRPMFETFARGINFVVPHAMWYNPENRIIEPLISSGNEAIADELPAYSKFVSRACLLLQGGRRVSEIGVLYPIEELSGFYNFSKPDEVRQGFYVSPETDYQAISALLSNDIRRDFTFVHPEFFLGDKYVIEDASVKLQNAENYQEYKVMFLTGSNVVSYKTLGKLKEFYDSGGTLISTTQLPSKSSERGADDQVLELVKAIFGQQPGKVDDSTILRHTNANGGLAVHLPNPTKETIQEVLDERMQVDVRFSPNPVLKTDWGKLNYIHKFRDGQHIYLFTNSSDEPIETDIILRGDLQLEKWDPHTGEIDREVVSEPLVENGQVFTKLKLSLDSVRSLFVLGSNTGQVN